LNDSRDGPTQSLLNPLGAELAAQGAPDAPQLTILLIISGDAPAGGEAFNAQFSRRR